MLKKTKAFTLVEALIVIVIIGVIAAIALPILNKEYSQKAMRSQLKKNYYVLTTVLERFEADNYQKLKGNDPLTVDKLSKYLKVYKYCPATGEEGENGCPKATDYYPKNMTNPYSETWKSMYEYGSVILQDGTLLMVGKIRTAHVKDSSTNIFVDVNGYDTPPNRMGEDLYVLQLNLQGEFYPMGDPRSNIIQETCKYDWWGEITGVHCAYDAIMKER